MLFEKTPKWEMAMVRMFGRRIVDEHGGHVCWMWRGKPYFRLSRY
jgi:hypothetical protein